MKPFLETTNEDWHGLMAANFHGYYYGCQAAARQMIPQGGGRIVNVTSIVDIQPIADLSAYVAAKGGIVALTKVLAVELGPLRHHGQRARAGCDGHAAQPGRLHARRAAYLQRADSRSVGSRRPRRSRTRSLFLASDASRYVTGHELVVDGGMVLNGNVGHAHTSNV